MEAVRAVRQCSGNKLRAAELLGITRKTLYARLSAPEGVSSEVLVHRCPTYNLTCSECVLGRAFFLLARAYPTVPSDLLRHDIEDLLWAWPNLLSPGMDAATGSRGSTGSGDPESVTEV